MANPWDADVNLAPEAARRLLEHQFPALAPARLEPLGTGWDNTAWLVNERLVFRFPRRRLAARLLELESRLLPRLAPLLPLPVPVPAWLGQPEGDYPYPFAGYPLLPGRTACAVPWTPEQRQRCAAPLGQFLSKLHGVAVDETTLAAGPGDELGRADLGRRLSLVLSRLQQAEPLLEPTHVQAIRHAAEQLARTPPWQQRPRWVHGDLYARHLLVDEQLLPCGVIDWGDLHLGDPALDLSLAFSFLPAEARNAFTEAYGPVDEHTWARARFRALHHGVILLGYGHSVGDEALERVGRAALSLALQD